MEAKHLYQTSAGKQMGKCFHLPGNGNRQTLFASRFAGNGICLMGNAIRFAGNGVYSAGNGTCVPEKNIVSYEMGSTSWEMEPVWRESGIISRAFF
jgi:hypothetical protein